MAKKREIKQLRQKLQSGNLSPEQRQRIETRIGFLGGKVPKNQAAPAPGAPAAPPADPAPNTPAVVKATNQAKPVARPGSVYRADQKAEEDESQKQILYQNPDTTTALGSTKTTINDDGTVSYDQKLSENQQQILDKGEQLTQQGQQMAGERLGKFGEFSGPMYGDTQPGGFRGAEYTGTQPQGFKGPQMPGQFQGGAGASQASNDLIGGYQKFSMTGGAEDRARIESAVFDRLNRDTEMNRGREMEAKQQELHNKGIPYSDDPNSRYQKEIGDINRRFDDITSQNRGQAVQMGGEELGRAYGMARGTHQQGLSDTSQLYGIGQQAYGTQLQGQQQEFGQGLQSHQQGMADQSQQYGQGLTTHQQGMADQGQQFGQDLTTHQQGLADIVGLQGQGTGLLMPNLPGYSAPQYDVADPSSYIYQGEQIKQGRKTLDQNQQQIDNENAVANKQLALAGGGSGGGAPQPPSFP